MDDATTIEAPAALKQSGGGIPMEKIIVAIHGVGSQIRSSTIRSVARRFGARSEPPLPVMPLGYFNNAEGSNIRWSRLDAKPSDPLAKIGFAEVYWADIPRKVVSSNDTLEETKAWARTVVSRAEAVYRQAKVPDPQLTREDFALGIGVVEEITETVSVLENLLFLANKAGLFKFELGELLRDYVGDVQVVTDFAYYRNKILFKFHSALAAVVATYQETYPGKTPEIYLVAHSEGTVISFLGLLQALAGQSIADPDDPGTVVNGSWIAYVRGFMTIGSPIDKHIALWPKLWEEFSYKSSVDPSGAVTIAPKAGGTASVKLPSKIKWRNYFDYGDPIGFRLESAVRLLQERDCAAFEFVTADHDFGFSRYWLPGKAHNDYWDDSEVFGHFIDDVVLSSGKAAAPPASSRLVEYVSKTTLYTVTFLVHLAAVFLLYRALTDPGPGFPSLFGPKTVLAMIALSGVLMCITVATRIPRLVKLRGVRWELASLAAFAVGAGLIWILPDDVANFLGGKLPDLPLLSGLDRDARVRAVLVGASLAVVLLAGWIVPRRPKWSRRTLIGAGALAVGAIIIGRLTGVEHPPPVWPVVLAGLIFIYLWWLGILLFDLTFIWHRYVREAVFVQVLRSWGRHEDAKPRPLLGIGPDEFAQRKKSTQGGMKTVNARV